jgi:chromosome segregation ATPase
MSRSSAHPTRLLRLEEKERIGGLNERLQQLFHRMSTLEEERKDLEQQLRQQRAESDQKLSAAQDAFVTEKEQLNKTNDLLLKSKDDMGRQVIKLTAKNQTSTQKNGQLKTQTNELKNSVSGMKAEKERLEKELNDLNAENEELRGQSAKIPALQKETTAQKMQLKALSKQRIQAEAARQAAENRCMPLQLQLQAAEARVAQLVVDEKGRAAEMERQMDARLKESREAGKQKLQQSVAEAKKAIRNDASRRLTELSKSFKEIEANLKGQVQEATETKDTITKENTMLQQQLSGMKAIAADLDKRQKKMEADIQRDRAQYHRELRELRELLEQARTRERQKQVRCEDGCAGSIRMARKRQPWQRP